MCYKFSTFLTDDKLSWVEIHTEYDKNSIKDEKRRKWTYTAQGFYIFYEAIKYQL